jgi:ATP-dependent DNA ligase
VNFKLLNRPAVSQELPASLPDLIEAVREQGFEGLVAKRRSSRYESGKRSGAWQKMRVSRSQDFVMRYSIALTWRRDSALAASLLRPVRSGPPALECCRRGEHYPGQEQ